MNERQWTQTIVTVLLGLLTVVAVLRRESVAQEVRA